VKRSSGDQRRLCDVRQWLSPFFKAVHQRSADPRVWLQLAVSAGALLVATWLFGKIAEDVVTRDRLTVVDEWLAGYLHRHATAGLTRVTLGVSELAGRTVVSGLALATALLLVTMRRWYWLLALVLVVPGGALFNELLKLIFQRARPVFDQPGFPVTGYSFPSGHTMMATLLYGFLAIFIAQTTSSWRWRMIPILIATALIPLVALSRMYLGAHYLSDTLAAIAAGVMWLMLCLGSVAVLRRRASRL
jgi:undecaprenyl-diphosphatase